VYYVGQWYADLEPILAKDSVFKCMYYVGQWYSIS